ncbi:MAG: hypothetical protein JXA52_09175 [Planctomycetes bacterium]|nr:hypothetical protein [Planctomycetota bacterium]
MKKLCAVTLILAMVTSIAGGSDYIARTDSLEILEGFDSVYIVDRIQAYRRAGEVTNAEVLAEFSFIDRLINRARSKEILPGERIAALKALVELSLNQMAQPKEMVDSLYQIIVDDNNDLLVRVDALALLQEFGRFDTERNMALEDTVKRVEEIVFEIANRTTSPISNPLVLRMEALKTIGALGPKNAPSVFKRILNSNRSGDLPLRIAAGEGLRNYILTRREVSPVLVEDLRKIADQADKPIEKDLRIICLKCIENLVQNGSRVIDVKGLYKLLYKRLAAGDDEEMIIASRCFLRVNDSEELENVLEAHIQQLQGGRRGKEARSAIFKALIEFFSPLGLIADSNITSRSDKLEAIKNAERIVDFLQTILSLEEAPMDLHINAVRGLGLIPPSLDRRQAAFALITYLRRLEPEGGNKELIIEIENSLKMIAALSQPFRTFDGQADVAAWQDWYNNNNKYLVPGDAPHQHLEP